jgi:hypothetical protein
MYKSCRWDQFEATEVINMDFNCIAVVAIFSASKNTSMTMIGGLVIAVTIILEFWFGNLPPPFRILNRRGTILNGGARFSNQTNPAEHRSCYLKVHKNDNFFGFNFEFCTISMLVMYK